MKRILLAGLICLAAASQCLAGPKVLTGNVTQQRVSQLTNEIHWFKNLSEAKSAAYQQGKMVFWVHMLGQIDGAT